MAASPEPVPTPSAAPAADGRWRRGAWSGVHVLVAVVAALLVVAGLRAARAVCIPVATGGLLALLMWPVHAALTPRITRWGSVAAVTLAVLLGAGSLGLAAWYAADQVVDRAREAAPRAQEALLGVRDWAERRGFPSSMLPAVDEATGDAGANPQGNEGTSGVIATLAERGATFLTAGLGATIGVAGALVLALFFMVYLLLEAPQWRRRLARVLSPEAHARVVRVFEEAAWKTGRYFGVKAVSGLVQGTLTAAWCWAMGVPMALTWGLLAFLFNYVQSVGAFISGVPPAVLGFLQLGPGLGLAFAAGLLAIETFVSYVVEPWMSRAALDIPASLVLASLLFWAWLWGAAGAVLSLPITVAVLVAMREAPRLNPIARVLLDDG